MKRKKKLAIAVTATSIAALGGGVASAGAQTQNEVLQATTTTFSAGGSGWCFKGSASATFSATGPATGPYPGNFTETSANASVSAPAYYTPRTLTLSIPFTISSGSTTITGMVTNPPPYSGGGLLCSNFFAGGLNFNATAATYTATIQREGLLDSVNGTAQVSGGFVFRYWRQVTLPTVTLLNFPSP